MASGLLARTLVVCALGTTLAWQPGHRQAKVPPNLLVLRGGVQPVERPTTPATVAARSNDRATASTTRNRPKLKKKNQGALGLQDAATAVLSLTALGAASIGADPIMAAAPRGMKEAVWMVFGSLLSSLLYLIMRFTNFDRAMVANRALAKLLLGSAPAKGPASSLPALAVVSVLGGLASFQTLPSMAS